MLWWAFSILFVSAALREIYYGFVPKPGYLQPDEISKSYLAIVLFIAAAFAYPPVQTWRFERFLTEKAQLLSETSKATVHCNTFFDTALSPEAMAAGYADMESGKIAFQAPWCSVLRKHLRNPGKMERNGIFSVLMFAHEAMHIRGESNEAITECQATQRHYRAARLLGVKSHDVAKEGARLWYESSYQNRKAVGGMQTAYYSDECAPGKALDEKLHDSTWN